MQNFSDGGDDFLLVTPSFLGRLILDHGQASHVYFAYLNAVIFRSKGFVALTIRK
jgi:hypothetical protein